MTSSAEPAAAARARRAQAARLLAPAAARAHLQWPDLSGLPGWAHAAPAELDRLAWATGAWAHAGSLRSCIDGGVLGLLHARLGAAAFAALMDGPADAPDGGAGANGAWPALDLARLVPAHIDVALLEAGRQCLLASIEAPALRACLRGLWWPALPPLAGSVRPAAARALVDAAAAPLRGVPEGA